MPKSSIETSTDAAHRHELRDQIIGALMVAEGYDFASAARIVGEFERNFTTTDDERNELSNTIWDGWMSRSF